MIDDSALTFVVHNKASLALHTLRAGAGRPLLLLHGLGERTPDDLPRWAGGWPGPVLGLDFTGHGRSTVPAGGGYTAEILMADVDTVLASVGEVSIVGRGLGAYIALLIAGARPELVRGIVLADGPGIVGGGVVPGTAFVSALGDFDPRAPDPNALFELSRDVRPPDYAQEYVRQVMQFSGLDRPIVVAAVNRPEWLAAVVSEPGVVETSLSDAITVLAAVG
jgi:pimeloyl-ACP methyl ester carboxylesterase